MKVKHLKTTHVWEVEGKRALELALNPKYEIIEISEEEREQIELLKEKEPPTIQELVFDYEYILRTNTSSEQD